jgi:NADPH:quinone reductase-like Zn-dependent oxidoreductase
VHVVLDTIGGETQQRSWKVLKPGGILVSVVSPPSPETAKALGVRQAYFFVEPNSGELAEIAKLVDGGNLKAVVETILPLVEARRAHEISQSGHARGKIVLRVLLFLL